MMTLVFEEIRRQLGAVEVELPRAGLEVLVKELSSVEAIVQERRLAALAAIDGLDDGGLAASSVARSVGRSSDRRAKADVVAASALSAMPATREALAGGEITVEHVEAAARAGTRAGDLAGADRELVAMAKAMPADVFDDRSRAWGDKREAMSTIAERHGRQRANRHVKSFPRKGDGGFGFVGSTDAVEGKVLWGAISEEADRLYRLDGGRDGGADVRTREQRLLDALVVLVKRGAGLQPSPDPGSGASAADGEAGPEAALMAAVKARAPKYQATVVIPLDRYLGDAPLADARAELVGDGPLPDSVLSRILCDADIAPLVVDRSGQPLWMGRAVRAATPGQWLALIVRDKGCKVCGAPPEHCEAHHVKFWQHGGRSDIGNFVLLCVRCHHQLHDHDLDLVEDSLGVTTLQPRTGEPKAKPPPTRRTRPPTRRAHPPTTKPATHRQQALA